MARFGSIQLRAGDSDSVQAGKKRFAMTFENSEGQREVVTEFDSTEDMVLYMNMKDEQGRSLYDTSASFRESIRDIAANSPALFSEKTLARKSPLPNDLEMMAGLREDALRQHRDNLAERAGGNDMIAKFELAQAMTNPEFAESANDLLEATEVHTPIADMLRARKQAGLGPIRYAETIDTTADDKREAEHNQAVLNEMGDSIVTLGDK